MPRVVALSLLGLLTLTSGCASIMTGTTQKVRIETDPDAKTTVDGRTYVGSTSVDLRRGQNHVLRVERSGFESKHVSLTPRMNGWVWGNLALGPLFPIGILVDAISGAINNVSPNEVRVELEAEPRLRTQRFERPIPPARKEDGPDPKIAREPETDLRDRAETLSRDLDLEANVPIDDNAPKISKTDDGPPKLETETEAKPSLPPRRNPHETWVVAVMEVERLRGDSGDDDVTQALTEQIRVFLAERGLRVVNRGAQEAALSSLLLEEKKRSYDPCSDAGCQIPLGRALAATHVLRATIGRFGQRCVVNAELIELEREVTVGAGAVPGDCTEEALLEGGRALADRLIPADPSP